MVYFLHRCYSFEANNAAVKAPVTTLKILIKSSIKVFSFVAFISLLVDRTYTATQYALLASIGTAGRTTLASSSGALVDWLNGDWGIFFILTAVMVIPSLIFLYMIKDKLNLNKDFWVFTGSTVGVVPIKSKSLYMGHIEKLGNVKANIA